MMALDAIAERRIREALERGELDGLPGSGAPLPLEDDALVPAELRAGYRLLRNAGFLPPELERNREIRTLEQLLQATGDPGERARVAARIRYLLSLAAARGGNLGVESDYFEKACDKVSGTLGAQGS